MEKGLLEVISASVNQYLQSGNKNRTRQTLANRAGLSYNTITRIEKGTQTPSYQTAYAILEVTEPENYLKILGEFFPHIGSYEKPTEKTTFNSKDLITILNDPISSKIFASSLTEKGITEAKVTSLYGSYGVLKLEEMIDAGLLVAEGRRIRTKYDCINDLVSLLNGIKGSVEHFIEKSSFVTRDCSAKWNVESLNEQARTKIMDWQRKCADDLTKIISDPINHGDLEVNVGMYVFSNLEDKR